MPIFACGFPFPSDSGVHFSMWVPGRLRDSRLRPTATRSNTVANVGGRYRRAGATNALRSALAARLRRAPHAPVARVRRTEEEPIPAEAPTEPVPATEPRHALSFPAGAPFELLKSLTCLDLLGIHVPDARLETSSLHVPIDVGGRALLFELTQRGEPEHAEVVATPLAGGRVETTGERARVGRFLEHLLGISDGVETFYARAREDDAFWRAAGTLESLHRVGFGTPFEGICWTILRQRQYPNVARARLRRLRERFGTPVPGSDEPAWAFPDAAAVAAASLESIRKEVKSRKKARYLREAAVAFAAEGDALDVLGDPPDELAGRLLSIRGVGPWSVRTFVGRAFNRPHLQEVVVDGAVTPYWRDVLGRFYGPDVDPLLVRERANAYGEWESYWLFYARFTHHAMKRAVDAAVVDA